MVRLGKLNLQSVVVALTFMLVLYQHSGPAIPAGGHRDVGDKTPSPNIAAAAREVANALATVAAAQTAEDRERRDAAAAATPPPPVSTARPTTPTAVTTTAAGAVFDEDTGHDETKCLEHGARDRDCCGLAAEIACADGYLLALTGRSCWGKNRNYRCTAPGAAAVTMATGGAGGLDPPLQNFNNTCFRQVALEHNIGAAPQCFMMYSSENPFLSFF